MIHFDRFELEPARRELSRDGESVEVGSRAFDILLALVRNRGRPVSKAELLELVWEGLVVEEGNVHVQISALRKLLGAHSIATIPGRGYQFTAAVDANPAANYPDSASHSEWPSALNRAATPSAVAAREIPHPIKEPELFGREVEIADACSLIERHSLLTIVGAPGIGKTTLARAIASMLSGRFSDGVFVVELASISDPALVPAAIARALDVPGFEERPSATSVAGRMAGLAALVVIDNCEHLLGPVHEMVRAISSMAPAIHILTTSQEPLRTSFEHLLWLFPLSVPPTTTLQEARRHAVVQMFCARAQAADPRFDLTEGNCEAVLEICRRLDGIPLAIELATARLRLLGVEGLRARLDDRFRLLTTGFTDAVPKHRTLRAALEWSHDLLGPAEQATFRRLGVFPGQFTLRAAQDVVGDRSIDSWAVLDHLASLVDRSLVTVEGDDAAPRYRLLETMRLFSLECLSASGEMIPTRHRHAFATLATLEELNQKRWTLTSSGVNALLEPEVDNVRAALTWAEGVGGDAAVGVAIAAKSSFLWEALHLEAEGIARMRTFERWAADPTPLDVQAAYWCARVFHYGPLSTAVDVQRVGLHAVGVARRLDDPEALYSALVRSAAVAARCGNAEFGLKSLAEARELEQASWPPRQRALRYAVESMCFEHADRLQDARAAQITRVALLVEAGPLVQFHARAELVHLEFALGNIDEAIARGRRLLADVTQPILEKFPWIMVALAWPMVADSRLEEAAELLKKGLPLLKGIGTQWQILDLLAQLWVKLGDVQRAIQLIACADQIYKLRGYSRAPHAERRRTRLMSELARDVRAAELAHLRDLGTALSEEEALVLAMDFPQSFERKKPERGSTLRSERNAAG